MGTRKALLSAVLAASILAPAAGWATVMVPSSLEEMSAEAVLVVSARVLAQESAWDKEHRKIYTYTELQVVERIAGPSEPKSIVIRTMGGEVGDIGMTVSGVPKFAVDEEVVVFLRTDPVEPQDYQVIGMSQGKFRLVRQVTGPAKVVPSVEGLAFVRRDGTGAYKVDESLTPETEMTIETLKARVLAARKGATVTPNTPTGPISVPK